MDGFLHPFHGWDHLLAMLAVGILLARDGWRKGWIHPAAFLSMLGVGAATGAAVGGGMWIEHGILATLLLLGAALLAPKGLSLGVMVPMVVLAGFFHGWAHGAELMAAGAGGVIGMIAGSVVLHALGLLAGRAGAHVSPAMTWRSAGCVLVAASLLGWIY